MATTKKKKRKPNEAQNKINNKTENQASNITNNENTNDTINKVNKENEKNTDKLIKNGENHKKANAQNNQSNDVNKKNNSEKNNSKVKKSPVSENGSNHKNKKVTNPNSTNKKKVKQNENLDNERKIENNTNKKDINKKNNNENVNNKKVKTEKNIKKEQLEKNESNSIKENKEEKELVEVKKEELIVQNEFSNFWEKIKAKLNKKIENKKSQNSDKSSEESKSEAKENKKSQNNDKSPNVKKSETKENKKNQNNDKNSNEKKSEVKENKKEKVEDNKPEYVQEMIKNKKRKMYIFICVVILIIIGIVFSTVFAIMNLNNTSIVTGVKIKNIDVSNLNVEDASNKIKERLDRELIPEINLKYNDYAITLKPEQIEFKYNIDEAVNDAYYVARSNNIVVNNYKLLTTAAFGDKVNVNYEYNEDLLNQFIDSVNSEIPGVVVEPSYYIENSKLIISKGTDGIQIQKEKLKELILSSIYSRNVEDSTFENFKSEINIPIENIKASDIDMDKIYSEVHKEPQDAYYETEPYAIYPDVDGVDLAISLDEAKAQIQSEDKEEYTFDLNITKAQKTINDLGKEAFPYVVSTFSTKYDASNVNRSTNLKIAAEKINGTVLMPGEEFSYNKVVGKRTVEEGYKDAAIYADGGVVDGLAGGICQISSTLYNAVLLANLEVTERRNHTYTTSYVPAGRDATVVWGTKDFKFKNSRSYPIKIEATVSNGIAEFKIHGVQEEKEYEIKILPVTTGSIPYSTSYVQDASLAPGRQIVSQNGHPGYKVTTYKEVRYNGEVVSKEAISNDTYSPMQTIIRVGPTVSAPVAQ